MRHQAEIWSKIILLVNEKQCPLPPSPLPLPFLQENSEGDEGGGVHTISGVQTTF